MRIEFLGSGGFHPNERRHTACVMLPEIGLIFDAGTSFFRVPAKLQSEKVQIFLSHAHLDHVVGLTFLLAPLLSGRLTASLIGTRRTLDAVRDHLFADALFPVQPPYDYVELQPRMPVRGGGHLTSVPLKHPGGSVGYRIDWPERSLAYITDTVVDGSYTEFVGGVDVLIHECYFPDDKADWALKTGHSHTTPVAELARNAGVKRLLLVHIDPDQESDDPIGLDKARGIFPQTDIVDDGLVVDF